MWEFFEHAIEHTIGDTITMLPFLFGAYLLLEYIEHRSSAKLPQLLARSGGWGPVGGALLGVVPQCGFSVAAANLYAGKVITTGTLVAVFISTSDEAIPVLLSNPEGVGKILPLLAVKVVVAIAAGLFIDLLERKSRNAQAHHHDHDFDQVCSHCGCSEHGILRSALTHTLQIYLFIFLFTFAFNIAIELIGEDRLSSFMLVGNILQPAVAALFGFIPNCATSVLLTRLYLTGSLSFGSVVAGLCTGAGVGLVVLLRANHSQKENLRIIGYLYAVAAVVGTLIELLG